MENTKKLYRSRTDRVIFGVCGGLGEYFDIDTVIVRIAFIIITLMGGSGVLLYLVLAVIVPINPNTSAKNKGSHKTSIKKKVEELAAEIREL